MPLPTATVLGQQAFAPGTYSTSSFDLSKLPNNPATGQPYAGFTCGGTMSQADASDPTKSLLLTLYASYDGVNYEVAFQYPWQGGIFVKGSTTVYQVPNFGTDVPTKLVGGVITRPQKLFATLDTQGNSLNTGLWFQLS